MISTEITSKLKLIENPSGVIRRGRRIQKKSNRLFDCEILKGDENSTRSRNQIKFAVAEVLQSFSQETRSVRICLKFSFAIEETKEHGESVDLNVTLVEKKLFSPPQKKVTVRHSARCVKVSPNAPHSQTLGEVISLTLKLSKVKMFSWGVTSFQGTSLRCHGIKSESCRGVVIRRGKKS